MLGVARLVADVPGLGVDMALGLVDPRVGVQRVLHAVGGVLGGVGDVVGREGRRSAGEDGGEDELLHV
jgi:hypothetical protein